MPAPCHPQGVLDLTEQVAALRAWAEARIAECREIETHMFTNDSSYWESIEKRKTLTEVLERLGYPVPPRDEREGTR